MSSTSRPHLLHSATAGITNPQAHPKSREGSPHKDTDTQTLPAAGVITPAHTEEFPSEEIMDRCGFALNKLIFSNYFKLLLEGKLHHLSNEFRLQPSPLHFQTLPSSQSKLGMFIPTLLCPIDTNFEVDIGTGWPSRLAHPSSDQCDFQLWSLQLGKERLALFQYCLLNKHSKMFSFNKQH